MEIEDYDGYWKVNNDKIVFVGGSGSVEYEGRVEEENEDYSVVKYGKGFKVYCRNDKRVSSGSMEEE